MTRADIPFVVLAIGSGAALLCLARSLTFYWDEWFFITFDGGVADYLRPYNEHWCTFPLMLYRATFALIGLRSYVPYLMELIVLHLLAVSGVYAIARGRLGALPATLVAVPLLLLGSGSQNLFWAFQTGFVGSVMFGVWALFFIERPGRRSSIIASALLVASLMSSGVGVFFLVATAARTLFDPALRGRLRAMAAPASVYVAWLLIVGHDAVGASHPFVADGTAFRFAARGVTFAAEAFFGLDRLPNPYPWGLLCLIVLSAAAFRQMVRRRGAGPTLAVACLLGLGTMYVLIAFVRAHLQHDFSTESRYVYVAAFFFALTVVDLLPRRESWSRVTSRRGMLAGVAIGAALGLSIAANAAALGTGVAYFQHQADATRAFIAFATVGERAPWVDESATWGPLPPAPELRKIVRRHGSPLQDQLIPQALHKPAASATEVALLAIVGRAYGVRPAAANYRAPAPLSPVHARGVDVSREDPCLRATFSGAASSLTVAAPDGVHIRMVSSTKQAGYAYIGRKFAPSRWIALDLEPDVARDLTIPDIGDGHEWQVELDLSESRGSVSLCAFRHQVRLHRSERRYVPDVNRTENMD